MTPDLDAVRAMMEGVTERIQEAADAVQAMGSYSGEDFARKMVAQTAIAAARELVPTLAAEVRAQRETIAGLTARVEALTEALTLVERLYYIEGKDAEWRASRMNGVAREAQDGNDLGHYRRIFPRQALSGDTPND